jgi:hypothetical protein
MGLVRPERFWIWFAVLVAAPPGTATAEQAGSDATGPEEDAETWSVVLPDCAPFEIPEMSALLELELGARGIAFTPCQDRDVCLAVSGPRPMLVFELSTCSSSRVVAELITDTGRIDHEVDLADAPPLTWPRTLALVAAELVTAERLRGLAGAGSPEPGPVLASPQPEREAGGPPVTVHIDDVTPAPRPLRLRGEAAGIFGFFLPGPVLYGAAGTLVLDFSVSFHLRLRAGLSYGRVEATLGVANVLQVGGRVTAAYGRSFGAWLFSIGPYLDIGYAYGFGSHVTAGVTEHGAGGVVVALGLEGLVGFPVSDRVRLLVAVAAGYVPVGVSYLSDETRSLSLSGWILDIALGLAFP